MPRARLVKLAGVAGLLVLFAAFPAVAAPSAGPPTGAHDGGSGADPTLRRGPGAGGLSPPTLTKPARFLVGFAKEDITPGVPFDYLGGDGYKRVATAVLDRLWERAVAIAPAGASGGRTGDPIVMVSVDSQGYFAAYQGAAGLGVTDYGYSEIRQAAAKAVGIPAGNIVFSSTHTHTAPDTLGVWGGSPTSYFQLVRRQGIRAVEAAVDSMRPAWIRRGTADGSAYAYNFLAPNAVATADHHNWPLYGTLTVLQALRWGTEEPIVTLVNFGVHPDILENTTYVSPDWPAAMIKAVTAAEGGHSLFLQGTLGSEPVLPASGDRPVEYSGISGHPRASAAEATTYGEAIASLALKALADSQPLVSGRVSAATVPIEVPATSALILGDDLLNLPSQAQSALGLGHIERADVPPYLTGNVVGSAASIVRIGNGAMFGMPGEIFADVFSAAQHQIRARWFIPIGLADDQLGYVVMPAEWPVAEAAGGATGPAAEYSISPETGTAIVRGLLRAAPRVGFRTHLEARRLVSSNDPVAAQLAQCVLLGFCAANNQP